MSQRVVRQAIMPNKNYSRNAEEVRSGQICRKAAAAKHNDTDESNNVLDGLDGLEHSLLAQTKARFVRSASQKMKNQIKFYTVSQEKEQT